MGHDTNISIDIAEFFDEKGLALPLIDDERSTDAAASKLAQASARYGEAFARDHSSLEAMISFVHDGGQTTHDEMFEAIFVPVAMSVGGRDADAEEAIARYRSALSHAADRQRYESFIARFGR